MRKQYKAVFGSQLSDTDAEIIAKELEHIRKVNGKVIPERVVERAREKTSCLHEYFNWDDKKAAYQYRLEQARHLIQSVVIEYVVEEKDIIDM